MSNRFLGRDLTYKTLDEINAEIKDLEALPPGQRSVDTVERLADLYEARERITGGTCSRRGRGPFLQVMDFGDRMRRCNGGRDFRG